MKLERNVLARVSGLVTVGVLIHGSALAADPTASMTATNETVSTDTRYGLFHGLDHRSYYSEGNFPEPFLVDDSGLEINEARLDWLHAEARGAKTDTVKAEVEKGFGLLTLELEVPYERSVAGGKTTAGFDNIDLGARYPFFQFVSAKGFFDTTIGAAIELGIPVDSTISRNTELVPKLFTDTKLGEHLTVQSVFGYSMLFGPGEDGGLRTFEYGGDLGYTIQHSELPIPGVQQFIPMFELAGETTLNHGESGRNSMIGNAAFRLNLKSIGRVQPRLGFGYVFPLDNNARADLRRGFFTSLVFEY
jgi:hypothetical protein